MKKMIRNGSNSSCGMQCQDCPLLTQIQNIADSFADAVNYIKNFSDDFLNRMLKTALSDESIQSSLIPVIDYFIKSLETADTMNGDAVNDNDTE